MSFESALVQQLSDATISALVGERVRPIFRPEEETFPCIVYTIISSDQMNNLSGRDTSLRNVRLQLDIWSRDHQNLIDVTDAVRTQMNAASTLFKSTMLPSSFDDYEPEMDLLHKVLEFSCWYKEA